MKYFFFIVYSFFITSCKQQVEKPKTTTKSTLKYAKGFTIITQNNTKKLIIKNPYPSKNQKEFTYTIIPKEKATKLPYTPNCIYTPINKIVVTSTTHIPMLELLNVEKSLIGFPHLKYISSKKTRALIKKRQLTEIGKEASLNTEILLNLKPELVVTFATSKTNKTINLIKENGIPVILNGDWLEETPLGRAEWIKFFGILYNKEKQADSIFSIIEKNYKTALKIAQKAHEKPTVFSGAIMNKNSWNLPAGNSFMSYFFKDANTHYLWQNTQGKGSLSISFESVLSKAKNAQYWIAPGYFFTKKQMLNSNKLYSEFKAFKNNLYSPNLKKGETGGILYFEIAPTRPDLVLKDIIKITHPELLKEYTFSFFEKMN